jgi:elongation factor P
VAYDLSDIKKNLKVKIDGIPFNVVEFQFVKPGKGNQFTRTKLRNMLTGAVIERTFKSYESLEAADIEEKQMQFLYKEGDAFVFMDTNNFEQLNLSADQLGENKYYLLDGTMVSVIFFNEKPISATPPTFVVMTVMRTEPGFKGDTSGGAMKSATMETGLEVNVPLFINEGELLKIDTRTGEYSERVNKR